uniref:Secreted protein n=1 Tax=Heterorhabditis bacteriophora TaxID=37862 RepID=A0A1I7X5Q7_HETBA
MGVIFLLCLYCIRYSGERSAINVVLVKEHFSVIIYKFNSSYKILLDTYWHTENQNDDCNICTPNINRTRKKETLEHQNVSAVLSMSWNESLVEYSCILRCKCTYEIWCNIKYFI